MRSKIFSLVLGLFVGGCITTPTIPTGAEDGFYKYKKSPHYRAFVTAEDTSGAWATGSGVGKGSVEEAIITASNYCKDYVTRYSTGWCELYSIGDLIVGGMPPDKQKKAIAFYTENKTATSEMFEAYLKTGKPVATGISPKKIEPEFDPHEKGFKDAKQISGKEIARFFSDSEFEVLYSETVPNFESGDIIVKYSMDGSLYGETKAGYSNRGTWWVKNQKICRKWISWFQGSTDCYRIKLKGNTTYAMNDDGSLHDHSVVYRGDQFPHLYGV